MLSACSELRIIKVTYRTDRQSFMDAIARDAQTSLPLGNEGRCGHPRNGCPLESGERYC
ncbi:hypothetical protein BN2476_260003 [Paraburkholderia piptadeniae]|uniref:Uncharacterized protein n=1 Tax=Paraburkholderia piptadeniae TaxID=1701573 RepID=A0A1N7S0U9_9BURK|nr:hypothetical protein BN2476_260003 [Paraburkholderia piptadeniae]